MTPQTQTTKTDCLRACIATLLDLPILAVPNFTEQPDHLEKDENGYQKWLMACQGWLRSRGFFMVEIPVWEFEQEGETFKTWMAQPMENYCLMIGSTPKGVRHMMVGKTVGDNFQAVHDPHPEKPGLEMVEAVAFLVPIDPAIQIQMGSALEKIERLSSNKVLSAANNVEIWREARRGLGKGLIAT